MKKILHIQVLPMLAGVQKISLEIFQSLPANEYERWILFSENMDENIKRNCQEAFENIGVKVIFFKSLYREICFSDIRVFYDIYKLCKKEHFDIVHTHSTKPGIVGRIAARLAGVKKVIHTVHGIAFHRKEPILKRFVFYGIEFLATFWGHRLVLVNSFYKKYYRFFKKRTIVIYNGFDFSKLDHRKLNKAEADDITRILFVGRLDKQKNPLILLNAASDLIVKYPNVRFTLVGEGELYESCDRYIARNKLEDIISLEGWKSDVSDYYKSHDIFCLPSVYEAFGLVFLEAGCYELPTVSTIVEGIPEVILDNKTGILISPNNLSALTDALGRLIEDKNLRITLGKQAKDWVTQQFPLSKMTNSYREIYN